MTNGNTNRVGAGEVLDYAEINERALDNIDDVLTHLGLDGDYQGKEYVALNPHRSDGEPGSFSLNTESGVWADFATNDRGGDIVSYWAFVKELKFQTDAAKQLSAFLDSLEATSTQTALAPQASSNDSTTLRAVPKAKTKNKTGAEVWTAIMPVPDDAPAAPERHYDFGSPTLSWQYLNEQGQLLGHIHRYDIGDKKEFRPQTFCSNAKTQQKQWRWLGFPEPRPLYGLEILAARPEAEVVICEGEKSADAARLLLPECVVVTTMNGAQSPGKTDLKPLAGRMVSIWPDHDVAGEQYAESVLMLLRNIDQEIPVRVMKTLKLSPGVDSAGNPTLEPRSDLPQGWDAADAAMEGWTPAHLALVWSDDAWFVVAPIEERVGPYVITKRGDANESAVNVFSIPPVLEKFVATMFPDGLIFLNQGFYAYTAGYFKSLDEQTEVRHKIAQFFAKDGTSRAIEETLKLSKDYFSVPSSAVAPNKALICLANGTLDTNTSELLPHSPTHRLTVANDIEWNPTASCQRWLQFIDEIFAPDIDKQQKIDFMQDWFGYCLVPDASQHKFVWMVGAGGNGKSVVLVILARIVGEVNVSHAHVENLGKDYIRAELDGKLVNISSEMSAEATISDGYLKSIVAGDPIEAARKYGRSFSFRPFVRMIGATNQLPRLLDLSDGFARRAVVIGFNRQFTGDACDPRLEEKLIAELPGILVWAVEGLRRLRERRHFDIPQSSDAALAQYRKESDPVALFVEECLDKPDSGSDKMTPAEIYVGYVEWNRANGYRQMNKCTFGKRLASHGFESSRSGGKNYWLAKIKDGNPVSNWYAPVSDFSVAATGTSQYASRYEM